jgi:hypothetical protein
VGKSNGRKRKESSTFRRMRKSQHVRDLRLIFYATGAAVILAAVLVIVVELEAGANRPYTWGDTIKYTWGDTIKFIGASAVAGATIMAWAYQAGSRRLGVVDLFACEITTLCRVGTVVGFMENMTAQYRLAGQGSNKTVPAGNPAKARFNSEENYFPVFESNARDLQILEADVVKHVTEFYTYMKATRDTLRQLSDLRASSAPVEKEREAVISVIYMVFLAYESARLAINELIEFQPTQAESKMVLLFTELPAYHFLRGIYADGQFKHDVRAKRLQLRWRQYEEMIPALCRDVRANAGDIDWEKAASMVDGLDEEYERAVGALTPDPAISAQVPKPEKPRAA